MLGLLVVLIMAGSPLPFSELIATSTPEDHWIDALAECESMGSTTIKVLDTDGYYSYGLLQFHLKTWIDFGKKFGTTKENIFDGELQKKVAKDMLNRGGKNHWFTCSRIVSSSLGQYP